MNERQQAIFGKISGEIALKAFPVEVVNPERFAKAREHLEHGSVLVYFNHFDTLDAIVYGKVMKENLTPLENTTILVAKKWLDPQRGLSSKVKGGIIRSFELAYHLKALPIVQTKDKENYDNPNSINRDSISKALRALKTPGKVVGVSPEGTRSKTGELLQAEEGFALLLKGKDVIALPLACVHKKLKPAVSTTVFVGESFTYADIQADSQQVSITDLAMRRLAALLPEENRGFYK